MKGARAVFLLFLVLSLRHVFGDEYHRDLRNGRIRKNKRPTDFSKHSTKKASTTKFDDHIDEKVMHPDLNRNTKAIINEEETNPEFWYAKAKEELELALKLQNREKKIAKNVILFLGDGMASASITTGRILKGQIQDKPAKLGAEAVLSMDTSDYMGFSKTYNVDAQVPDSAGTATAYLTGVKTDLGVLGLTAAVTPEDCSTSKGIDVQSVLMDSHDMGKSTGIVTTTRLNHATPGGAYAHTPYRYWYGDTDLPEDAVRDGCTDIAYQLFSQADKINVLLGGGRKYFRPRDTKDEEYGSSNSRADGQDLIEKWKVNMKNMKRNAQYVWNKKDFDNVDSKNIDHLWGMFEPKDMQYEVDRNATLEPSLTEMTEKAIEILQNNENGYYLLVEGGRIDHAHHSSNAFRAIHEVVEFDNAIARARELTSKEDTLIVVTADHGHVFTFAGYPDRGNPLFGLSGSPEDPEVALDLKPWSPLLYGNGEGYMGFKYNDASDFEDPITRQTLTAELTSHKDYLQQSAVPRYIESHGGDDIPILATGPMAHLFHSVHEQSYIAHVMRYASCVGGVDELCKELLPDESSQEKTVTFLGYQLDQSGTEKALNAMFGLEIAFVGSTILSYLFVRKRR